MLNYVTNSIVMGNGHPSLFEQASFVTKSIEDDGIEHALKYFEIIARFCRHKSWIVMQKENRNRIVQGTKKRKGN